MKLRFILIFSLVTTEISANWVSLFHKKITIEQVQDHLHSYTFTKENITPFTQLLFSWNATRPKRGHFTFYVQARNACSKKWGSWHHMADWGNGVQSSYETKSDGFTKYVHVRLETEGWHVADAFRLRIAGVHGAPLTQLKAVAVTCANRYQFKTEPFIKKIMNLASIRLSDVPKISQFALKHRESDRICSPTSCTMLTRYLAGCHVDPKKFAEKSYDKGLKAYGSWPFNMAHAFEKTKGKYWFFNTRLNSFVDLYAQLVRGIPVVVSVRGVLHGAPQAYPNGHLLIVVGWDQKTKSVICHDPAMKSHQETEKRYRIFDFLKAWEESRRLTYWASKATA